MTTRYGYDGAGQLTTATTTNSGDQRTPAVVGWEYDVGGRLVAETLPDETLPDETLPGGTVPGGVRLYAYDIAGQLLSVTEPDGSGTVYVHDGLGRRTRLIGPDGSWTEYVWGPTGYLKSTTNHTPDGTEIARHEVWVDALGELASIDDTGLWWDTANPVPTLAGIAGGQVLSLPGGLTGAGEAWLTPGWRAGRPTEQTDPWAVLGAGIIPTPTPGTPSGGIGGALPAGVNLTGTGGADVAGLEWLGARAYDPATRALLSTDPLAPVLGAGWDGNPYAYAGNNPLNTTDPTGLQPMTDAELSAHDGSTRGAMAAAGDFMAENWEYFAGGAMVIAGGVLMATGVGGPAGLMLIAAGADTIIQKATTGDVNWGEVALSGAMGAAGAIAPLAVASGAAITGGVSVASQKITTGTVEWNRVRRDTIIGGVAGGVGGGVATVMSKAAPALLNQSIPLVGAGLRFGASSAGRAAVSSGASGATANVGNYHLNDPGEKTVGGYTGSVGTGFATGGLFSVGGGKIATLASSKLAPAAQSTGRHVLAPLHSSAPNVARFNTLTNIGVDHALGLGQGAANQFIRPGAETDFRKDVAPAMGLNFILGLRGMTAARH